MPVTADFYPQGNPGNPLEVTFQGISSSTGIAITGWAWTFGDGTGTATIQTPTYTYTNPGIYVVTLVVTGSDGSTSSKSMYLQLTATPSVMSPIMQLIQCKIPAGIFDYACTSDFIRKWQLMLQPQVPTAQAVSDANIFNEAAWPALFNVLIAEIATYETILEWGNKLAITGVWSTINSSPFNPLNNNLTSPGSLKKLEVGPSDAEWYENPWANMLHQSEFAKAIFSNGKGMIEQYKQLICILAQRLFVTIPFCPQYKRQMLFIKAGRPRVSCAPTFPWGVNNAGPGPYWGYQGADFLICLPVLNPYPIGI